MHFPARKVGFHREPDAGAQRRGRGVCDAAGQARAGFGGEDAPGGIGVDHVTVDEAARHRPEGHEHAFAGEVAEGGAEAVAFVTAQEQRALILARSVWPRTSRASMPPSERVMAPSMPRGEGSGESGGES